MFTYIFSYYKNLSIAKKLKFMGISTALFAGSLSIIFVMFYQYHREKQIVELRSTTLVTVLAENIAPALLFQDPENISKILSSVKHLKNLQYAYVLDTQFNIQESYSRDKSSYRHEDYFELLKSESNVWKANELLTIAPIMVDNEQLGSLVIVASLKNFFIRLIEEMLTIMLIVSTAVAITFRYRAQLLKMILDPIAKLNEATNEIIKTKNLTQKVPIFNNDETGQLAQSFNIMLEELNRIHQQLTKQKDNLAHQAQHDTLTNLPNRLLFNDRLEQTISKAKRNNELFGVFFLDLDRFKQINDSLGHDAGDEVLKIFARRIQNSIRDEDTLARMGGDEFMLIMPSLDSAQSTANVAQKIIKALEAPLNISKHQLYLSASIGISIYPQDGNDVQTLIKNADAAMYKAKDSGRNNYQYYTSEMTELAFERVLMETNLRRAVEYNELIVYYQPQIDAANNKLIGMEALVRWNHPDLGIVSPGRFLPLAEETGLNISIDRLVMTSALEQFQKWLMQGLNPGKLSLNLSMNHLMQTDFITFMQQLFETYSYNRENIELEITEGDVMQDPEHTIETLQIISDMGIKLAVDDFGTGYSSLSYLKRLPINKLKIDQSFVRDLPYDDEDVAITKTIIALTQNMHLEVIAEGVETSEQRDFLIENGCHNIQGYLYAKPMPSDEMERFLKERL